MSDRSTRPDRSSTSDGPWCPPDHQTGPGDQPASSVHPPESAFSTGVPPPGRREWFKGPAAVAAVIALIFALLFAVQAMDYWWGWTEPTEDVAPSPLGVAVNLLASAILVGVGLWLARAATTGHLTGITGRRSARRPEGAPDQIGVPVTPELGAEPAWPDQHAVDVRTDAYAPWAAAFGVLAWLCLPLVGAVTAVVLGRISLRRIAADPHLSGKNLATTGLLLGGVQLGGLVALVLLLLAVGMLVPGAFEDLSAGPVSLASSAIRA